MVALLVVGAIAVIEAVVIVIGRNKLKADAAAERAKFEKWLAALPGKAEVAIRREAEVLVADIKKKV